MLGGFATLSWEEEEEEELRDVRVRNVNSRGITIDLGSCFTQSVFLFLAVR